MIAIIAAYAADGRPIWFFFGVNPFRTYNNFDVRQELCRGPVYEPRGPWFGAPYVGDAFNLGELVGSIELEGSTTLDGDFPFTGFTVRYAIRGFNRQVGLGRFNY